MGFINLFCLLLLFLLYRWELSFELIFFNEFLLWRFFEKKVWFFFRNCFFLLLDSKEHYLGILTTKYYCFRPFAIWWNDLLLCCVSVQHCETEFDLRIDVKVIKKKRLLNLRHNFWVLYCLSIIAGAFLDNFGYTLIVFE